MRRFVRIKWLQRMSLVVIPMYGKNRWAHLMALEKSNLFGNRPNVISDRKKCTWSWMRLKCTPGGNGDQFFSHSNYICCQWHVSHEKKIKELIHKASVYIHISFDFFSMLRLFAVTTFSFRWYHNSCFRMPMQMHTHTLGRARSCWMGAVAVYL